MKLAHSIGDTKHSNYHTREQILRCNDPIGFDGIYKSVYDNQDVLQGKSGIFFIMGDFVGGDNSFDIPHVPKLESYCNWDEIKEMASTYDFEIGWHTWSHDDLTLPHLSNSYIIRQLTPPFPMDTFAYPYGRYNKRVVDLVKSCGYKKAYSVTQGVSKHSPDPDKDFKIHRDYIKWD